MTNSKNVPFYIFGKGSINDLPILIEKNMGFPSDYCIFFIDHFFTNSPILKSMPIKTQDLLYFVSTEDEPTTDYVNMLYGKIQKIKQTLPSSIVGMGGGCTLDTAKAVSNLLTNGGIAENYQGWDLVKVPGVYKIGIPTISGTGAESSRTCVLTNRAKNLKLGMNSEHTIYDQLILDADLSATVLREQYFYTGIDTYIHCVESLRGSNRHAVADSFSNQALSLSKAVFGSDDMQSSDNREKLMVASYLGGCAIANSYVGLVHPLSAGLSTVLKIHHGLANCLVMNVMEEFYPEETKDFHYFMKKQGVELPSKITSELDEEGFTHLYESTIIHEKPLINALGENFMSILTKTKAIEIFKKI
jgi:3-deoxy-alpha-D-manno-octulosonate 8-oxidase